jgi:hypothetical protein
MRSGVGANSGGMEALQRSSEKRQRGAKLHPSGSARKSGGTRTQPRAAYPRRCSSNANGLRGRNSARIRSLGGMSWLKEYLRQCRGLTRHHGDCARLRMSFTNFTTGKTHVFGGKYLDLVPDELIRYTDRFEDPNLLGEMITTVTLQPVSVGTEVNIVQEGLPAAIPIEACFSAGSSRSITSPCSSSPRSRTEAKSDVMSVVERICLQLAM